jgi:hypothetical protein
MRKIVLFAVLASLAACSARESASGSVAVPPVGGSAHVGGSK